MAALGADMITIKDMSGLIPPKRVSGLIKLFKKHLSIPIDFHTHCTPATAWLPSWPLSRQEPISSIRIYGISRAVRQLRPSN